MSILLPFPSGCVVGRLIRREKRFFVHVLIDGKPDVAHTNNTGSMIGLLRPGAPVLLSPAQNPERKLRWTLELVWCGDPAAYPRGGFWAGVNTSTPNRMLEAAFRAGKLPWAEGYTSFAREKVRGESRLDGLLEGPGMPRLWVECKYVTMSEDDVALFPDAVSERGLKHLGTLKGIVAAGERAAMFYCIQRPDACCFGPADMIDPAAPSGVFPAAQGGRLPRGQRGLLGAPPLRGPLCNPPGTPRFSAASSGLLACRATALFLFGFSLSAIRRRCAADAPGANPVCDRVDLPPRSAKPLPFLLRMKIERCWLSLRNKMKFHIF